MTTIFGKIIAGELPADKVYEDDTILVIKDIYPRAPVHLLIIPKKEISDLQSVTEDDLHLMGDVIRVTQKLAEEFEDLDQEIADRNKKVIDYDIEEFPIIIVSSGKEGILGIK